MPSMIFISIAMRSISRKFNMWVATVGHNSMNKKREVYLHEGSVVYQGRLAWTAEKLSPLNTTGPYLPATLSRTVSDTGNSTVSYTGTLNILCILIAAHRHKRGEWVTWISLWNNHYKSLSFLYAFCRQLNFRAFTNNPQPIISAPWLPVAANNREYFFSFWRQTTNHKHLTVVWGLKMHVNL
jgi:hypothetical protein